MKSNCRSKCLFSALLLAILLSTAFPTHAQTPAPTPSPTPEKKESSLERQFFKNVLHDQKAIWTAPFHMHQREARWLVPGVVGTAALIATDRRTGDEIAESNGPLDASRIISYAGSAYGAGAVAATFYLVGRSTGNYRARETGVLAAEAMLDSAIVVTALKAVTQRRRPTAAKGRSDFFDGGTSFPSGHSITAWSLATIVANEYHDHVAVQIAAYGIASAVSVARFTGRNHYLSDVLVGGALGYGIGKYVYATHHRKRVNGGGGDMEELSERSKRWPFIMPEYDRHAHSYGVALFWRF